MVLPHLQTGGAGRQTISLAKGLSELENVEIFLLVLSREGGLSEELPSEIEKKIVYSKLEAQCSESALGRLVRPVLRIISVVRAAKRFDPDVIYARVRPFPSIVAGKILGIPVVIAEMNNPSKGLGTRKSVLSRLRIFIVRKTNRKLASRVVANSYRLADESKKFWKLNSKPSVIHNGLDIKSIEKKSRESIKHPWLNDNDIPLIVSVGRLVPQKGFSNLIEAVAIVNLKAEARLMIIGRIDERKVKNRLQKQIDSLNLSDRVLLAGDKPNPYPFMKAADVYVSSSIYEGFSNSLLEALALGLPVVSTNHDFGADEMIEDNKSGILIPVADPRAMAEAIVRILENRELSERLSRNARRRAENFTIAKTASEYEKLFREFFKN